MRPNSDASPATTPWGCVVGEGAELESYTTLLSASEKSDSSSTNTTDDVSEGGRDGAVGAGSGTGSGALPESQST